MNITKYLKRINYLGKKTIDEETMILLHEHHVLHVPFENLDIHLNRLFDLKLSNIYKKVVIKAKFAAFPKNMIYIHFWTHLFRFSTSKEKP
jgi:N-hydroxyarylamine O-acetyltransferase